MKCWYQVDNEWYEGNVTSTRGDRDVSFCCRYNGAVKNQVSLSNASYLFNSDGMSVTGYRLLKDNDYRLDTVEIAVRRPKEHPRGKARAKQCGGTGGSSALPGRADSDSDGPDQGHPGSGVAAACPGGAGSGPAAYGAEPGHYRAPTIIK